MDKDIQKDCYTFRSYVRSLRRSINDICYFFRDESDVDLSFLRDSFHPIDDILFLLIKSPNLALNEKIDAMQQFYENIFPKLDASNLVSLIEPKVVEAHSKIQERVNAMDLSTLDEKKKVYLENLKKKLLALEKPFGVEEAVDVMQISKQMLQCFNPQKTIDISDVKDVLLKYISIYQLNSSIQNLKEFKVPEKMTKEQMEIKKLKEEIKKLNDTIKEQKEQISKIQQEKMNYRRENIQLKKENEMLTTQNDEYAKRNTQMSNRLQSQPTMRKALEDIYEIMAAPRKERT